MLEYPYAENHNCNALCNAFEGGWLTASDHHINANYQERSQTPFAPIKDHVLLPVASVLEEADHISKKRLTPEAVRQIVGMIPDLWLNDPSFSSQDAHRMAYVDYLLDRLAHSQIFVEEALRARNQLV